MIPIFDDTTASLFFDRVAQSLRLLAPTCVSLDTVHKYGDIVMDNGTPVVLNWWLYKDCMVADDEYKIASSVYFDPLAQGFGRCIEMLCRAVIRNNTTADDEYRDCGLVLRTGAMAGESGIDIPPSEHLHVDSAIMLNGAKHLVIDVVWDKYLMRDRLALDRPLEHSLEAGTAIRLAPEREFPPAPGSVRLISSPLPPLAPRVANTLGSTSDTMQRDGMNLRVCASYRADVRATKVQLDMLLGAVFVPH